MPCDALFNFDLRTRVSAALTSLINDALGEARVTPDHFAIDIATRNICYAGLVPPETAKEDRDIVDAFLRCSAGRPSLRLIVMGLLPQSQLEALAAFADENPLVNNGRERLRPTHALAVEMSRVWIALGLKVSKQPESSYALAVKQLLLEVTGSDTDAGAVTQWVFKRRLQITGSDEAKAYKGALH